MAHGFCLVPPSYLREAACYSEARIGGLMIAGKWALCFFLTAGAVHSGEPTTVNERLVELSMILGKGSQAEAGSRMEAIREIVEMRTTSGLAAGMIFDRTNVQFEPSPEVREAAALAVRSVCDPRNRMFAMRLCRVANAAREPDPRVRIAALRSLAAFECADAAAGIYEARDEAREPDPQVREVAKELIRKGLAASAY